LAYEFRVIEVVDVVSKEKVRGWVASAVDLRWRRVAGALWLAGHRPSSYVSSLGSIGEPSRGGV
jgi:hypothetical protein